MAGQMFYNKRGIQITDDSFLVNGGTYPITSIRSAEIRTEAPQRVGPIVCIVLGAIFSILLIGLPLLIFGVVWLANQKSTYWLVINTAAGSCEVLSAKEGRTVREVQSALLAAIAHLSLGGKPPAEQLSPAPRDTLMMQLLKVAKGNNGYLSVTQGVMDTGASFTDVESTLQEMVKAGYVSVANHPDTGVVIYKFVEIA
ncbi:DUF6232 family protein [Neosynechococcus sphagnicola]|uniref:DUF6232 family protein n=1 Tax=Neosynechococcus sphagnicola TaxID=1501145 RepID=UPI00068A9A5F|nr:DUF6232 family protein [Neosynechococcus sphagnicola]